VSLRVLVLGAGGQLGRAVSRNLPSGGQIFGYDSASLDVRDAESVRRAVADASPDVIVNCAAWTDVDDAESHRDEAFEVNARAPAGIGRIALEEGARVLHISSDYVFDGEGGAPYATDAEAKPSSVYGASKLEGERRLLDALPAAVVVRTGWIHSGDSSNFVATAVRLLGEGKAMEIVDDQIGTPTRADNLARALWLLAERPAISGVLHFTDAGVASRYDVGQCVLEVLREAGRVGEEVTVTPVDTARFPRPADRPRCSVLDKHGSWQRIGWTPPHWRAGVIASTRELIHA
jgi:dTDP-4-dehydrorhamnose reductase